MITIHFEDIHYYLHLMLINDFLKATQNDDDEND